MKTKKPLTRFDKIRDFIRGIYEVVLPNKTEKENVLQYLVRQFYLCDDKGNPSLTVTILIYVMILVAIVTAVECKIALTPTIIYQAGVAVKSTLIGFSAGFLSLIISLSVVITTFYRWKAKAQDGTEAADQMGKGMIDKIKDYISSVIGAGKAGTPPTPPTPTPPQGPVGK